jgi:hypothetical protein
MFFTIRPSDLPPMLLTGHITAHYTPVIWLSLYTRRKAHWLMLIDKTLLGITPPSQIPTAAIILHIQHPFFRHILLNVPKALEPSSLQFDVARDWNEMKINHLFIQRLNHGHSY